MSYLQEANSLNQLENEIYSLSLYETYKDGKGLSFDKMKKIKKMKMSESKKLCSICICQFQKDDIIRKLPCKHIFHNNCIKPWLKRNTHCPYCRYNLEDFFYLKKIEKKK